MRKPSRADGFFLCFAYQLLFNTGWAALALLLWLLRLWLGVIPLFVPLILLGVWLLSALLTTIFFSFVAETGNAPSPQQSNKNPYSATNTQVFGQQEANPAEAFLDGLMESGVVFYYDWKNECEDMAAALSASALQQGLPPIPEGLLDPHPMQADPHAADGKSEMLGGMAAVYIAQQVQAWRVFLIDDGSDGGYAGAVPHENADTFTARLRKFFWEIGCGYRVTLL